MPTSKTPAQQTLEDQKKAFVTVQWNGQIDDRFNEWLAAMTFERFQDALSEVMDTGLRITLSKLDESYVSTIRDRIRETAGKPCVLSGWGENSWESLTVALFKHFELCVGCNWDTFGSENRGKRH